jgi:excisionase family DNA binding protein
MGSVAKHLTSNTNDTRRMNRITTLEKLIGGAEAASLLGVHIETIARWSRTGRIPSYRVGRIRRFKPAELLALLKPERAKS